MFQRGWHKPDSPEMRGIDTRGLSLFLTEAEAGADDSWSFQFSRCDGTGKTWTHTRVLSKDDIRFIGKSQREHVLERLYAIADHAIRRETVDLTNVLAS
jgi:hypothetical protein